MQNEFTTSLPLIQKLKDLDLKKLIKMGSDLYKKYQKINIDEKFSQLTENKAIQIDIDIEKSKAKGQERDQVEGKEQKQSSWSYADLLKSTTNYLGKLKHWTSKEPNK